MDKVDNQIVRHLDIYTIKQADDWTKDQIFRYSDKCPSKYLVILINGCSDNRKVNPTCIWRLGDSATNGVGDSDKHSISVQTIPQAFILSITHLGNRAIKHFGHET